MKTEKVTVVIIARNAEASIAKAVRSARFVASILVLDDGSKDKTVEAARAAGAKVVQVHQDSFAEKRNEALKHVETEWVFYLDADEEISDELRKEIELLLEKNEPNAFKVKRENWFLGEKMYPDYVERFFHRTVLKQWTGKVHESPLLTKPSLLLESPLLHHTHTSIASMLEKTNRWSEVEAELRVEQNHPPVYWWRLFRVALTEGWHQLTQKQVWRYGRAGWFEAYFQMVDKVIVMVKLWERQQAVNRKE